MASLLAILTLLLKMTDNFRHAYGRWLATIYFCLGAFVALISGPNLIMLLFALLGLALFAPPLQRLLQPYLRFTLKGWKAFPVFAILFVALTVTTANKHATQASADPQMAKAEAAAKADADYYAAHKAEVLEKITALVKAGNYPEAVTLANRYKKAASDKDLEQATNAAMKANYMFRLGEEKNMSASQKAFIYNQLVKLEPDNKQYAAQAAEFTKVGNAEERKLAAIRAVAENREARKAMLVKQFSRWDGSHPSVVKAVKQTMKNPASYEHVETRFGILDHGMRVVMTFRGTNSFGGVVPNTVVAKLDDDGNVLSIESAK